MFVALSDAVNEVGFVADAAAVYVHIEKCIGQQVVERLRVFGEFGLVPEGFEREHFRGQAIIRAVFLRRDGFELCCSEKSKSRPDHERPQPTSPASASEKFHLPSLTANVVWVGHSCPTRC